MRYMILVVAGFCLFCGWLVVESGLFDDSSQIGRNIILLQNVTANEDLEIPNVTVSESEQPQASDSIKFTADNASARTITLGAKDPMTEDPDGGFRFQLELSTKGAAIRKATFSNGNNNGFDDRDYKNPQPLVIILSLIHI